jgi:hypothetical protein
MQVFSPLKPHGVLHSNGASSCPYLGSIYLFDASSSNLSDARPCGEGACFRSTARSRKPGESYLSDKSGIGAASQPSGSKLPRHKSAIPNWILHGFRKFQSNVADSGLEIGTRVKGGTSKGRKECIHNQIHICYAMDDVQNRVGPISSQRLCTNAAEYSLIGGWDVC